MYVENLMDEGLSSASGSLTYRVSRTLASLFPDKAILGTPDRHFDLQTYAAAGQCLAVAKPSVFAHFSTYWAEPDGGILQRANNAWFEVSWQGHRLDVLLMGDSGCTYGSYDCWILAEAREVAESFFGAVCEWGREIRREIMIFQEGGWQRSEALYRAIKGATWENLILRGSLKREIQQDFAQFFAARATYERYGVPWKRGLLFLGPPGNGKTHAVKALLNSVEHPCLYVKSFGYACSHYGIAKVFERARQTTPCILVLEDLDSLINDGNRSFFLNELDGFAANEGILTIATTNHAERLDPAILERPSRFDRKYHFELPAPPERLAYIRLWNDTAEPDMRLSECAVTRLVERTEGFSFAYLKELFLSSMVRWIATARPGGMDTLVAAQAATLREQMTSMAETLAEEFSGDGEFEEDSKE